MCSSQGPSCHVLAASSKKCCQQQLRALLGLSLLTCTNADSRCAAPWAHGGLEKDRSDPKSQQHGTSLQYFLQEHSIASFIFPFYAHWAQITAHQLHLGKYMVSHSLSYSSSGPVPAELTCTKPWMHDSSEILPLPISIPLPPPKQLYFYC